MQPIYILYGVSGSGKTTIGKLLARKLGIPFFDADDFHPDENIRKMKNGIPLNDTDRAPWLVHLSTEIEKWSNAQGAVLACSALKENYRQKLDSAKTGIHWILLDGSFDLIKHRMIDRSDHFMPSDLLKSQFDTLEIPNYGLRVSVEDVPELIIQQIMRELNKSAFGVLGLGVMGKAIARNILDNGISLSVFNRSDEDEANVVTDFLSSTSTLTELKGFTELSEFVKSLQSPRKILMMVKAGSVIDSLIDQLILQLDEGDIIIDGGNSFYKDTSSRISKCHTHGIQYIGMGVSGGENGARFGPSLMPGGSEEAINHIHPILNAIAAKDKSGEACSTYVGPDSAGHFVKMVHNGIEYVEMQLLAEVYDFLRPHYANPELAQIFQEWNSGSLQGYLLEITSKILQKKENGTFLIDQILDKAGSKGTGSWSTATALELGSENSMMSSAVFARYLSSQKEIRQQLAINHSLSTVPDALLQDLKKAYEVARALNHLQGFELIRIASEEYNWSINMAEIARIWTNGCIIRSALMEELALTFLDKESLINASEFIKHIRNREDALSKTLSHFIKSRIATPAFSAAWNYWIGLTTERGPTNLIQAQRDYFGSHTYQRLDDSSGAYYHTNWEE